MTFQSQDPKLNEIIKKLASHFHPIKIFLFGSTARGMAGADSDYDIFIVVKSSEKSQLERMDEANFVLWGRDVPVDVFVYTEEEFSRAKEVLNSISYAVATEGLELGIG